MARPKKRNKSTLKKAALPAAIILAAALGAGAAWYLLRPGPHEPEPVVSPESVASLLAERTVECLSQPPLKDAGTILYNRKDGGKHYQSLAWRGSSGSQVIIAEKAIEDLWRSLGQDLTITITYPEHSEEGEKVRLSAKSSGAGLVLVKLFAGTGQNTNPHPAPAVKPQRPEHSGKIAIIIDDIGNDLQSLRQLLEIQQTLTFSVLPYAEFTDRACQVLEGADAHVMLHMPMEPVSYPQTDPGPGALLMSLDKEQIKKDVREALSRVPCATGMNNHMGSAFTTDPRAMAVVMEVLASRGMFFIDSRTTAQTVAYTTAQDMGVPSAERRVFLDHDPSFEAVRQSLLDLALEAEKRGSAIGIGHPYPETIEVLKESLPGLSAMGYEFVPAGELAR